MHDPSCWYVQALFNDRIAQLVYTFPEDATTASGTPFWSAPKRFPTPVSFTASDGSHARVIQAAALLKAEVHGLPQPAWALDLQQVRPCRLACDPVTWRRCVAQVSKHSLAAVLWLPFSVQHNSVVNKPVQVAEAAGQVPVAEFQPQQGVHIETDPTKTDKAGSGDDASIIDGMVAQLRVRPTASEAVHVLKGARCWIPA